MRDRDRSTIHGIRGPILVITVGVLFAVQNFTQYSFGETWPVLVIVVGLLSLLGRAVGPVPPAVPPAPPYTTYQPPQAPPAPGGYRQTPYAQAYDPHGASGYSNNPANNPPNNPSNNPGGAA